MEQYIHKSVLQNLLINVLDIVVRLRVLWGRVDLMSYLRQVFLAPISKKVSKHTRGKSLPTNAVRSVNDERVHFTCIWEDAIDKLNKVAFNKVEETIQETIRKIKK